MIRQDLKARLLTIEKETARALKLPPQARFLWDVNRHAYAVAATVLYGDPKITESFVYAMRRMSMRLFDLVDNKVKEKLKPESHDLYFRSMMYPMVIFQTNSEIHLDQTLQKAPHWLLKFTGAHWDAAILGIALPELLSAPELAREARVDRDRWPGLPLDTIDAGGPADQPEEPVATTVERLRREYWLPIREQQRRIAIDCHDWYYMPIYEGEPTLEINRRYARVHNIPFDDLDDLDNTGSC